MMKFIAVVVILCLPAFAKAEVILLSCDPSNQSGLGFAITVNTLAKTIFVNNLPTSEVLISDGFFLYKHLMNGILFEGFINRANGAMSVRNQRDSTVSAFNCSRRYGNAF